MSESCKNNDLGKKENLKLLNLIDVETTVKVMFGGSNLFLDEKQTKFSKDCLQFNVTVMNYLHEKLPYNVPVLKHVQFQHPDKQNGSGATNAISNIALKGCIVLKNCQLFFLFLIHGKGRCGRPNQKSITYFKTRTFQNIGI